MRPNHPSRLVNNVDHSAPSEIIPKVMGQQGSRLARGNGTLLFDDFQNLEPSAERDPSVKALLANPLYGAHNQKGCQRILPRQPRTSLPNVT